MHGPSVCHNVADATSVQSWRKIVENSAVFFM